jgi:hypothetical protein
MAADRSAGTSVTQDLADIGATAEDGEGQHDAAACEEFMVHQCNDNESEQKHNGADQRIAGGDRGGIGESRGYAEEGAGKHAAHQHVENAKLCLLCATLEHRTRQLEGET